MPSLSLSPTGSYLWVGCLALGLLLLLILGPVGSRTTPRRRGILLGLRLAVFLLVILSMLRPTLVYTEKKQQQATLIVLVDRSRSMQVADSVGNQTRWETLSRALKDAAPALAELSKGLEVKVFGFDADASELSVKDGQIALPAKPEGQQTAIGWVLEDVLRRETGKRLAGVILLSDGAVRAYSPRDVPPQIPAGRLRDLSFKLYTVAFGQARGPGQAKDIALRDLLVNPTVFVKNELSAGGGVRVEGFVDQQFPVQLLFETQPDKMEPVAVKQLKVAVDGQQVPLELGYVPQVPGEYKLTLRAAPQPGELVTTNNEMSTFVTVLKGGLNVSYLEGGARNEMTFLRRSLEASPDIKVDFLRINAQKPQTKPGNLLERFQPGKYDVHIIGDLDATAFNQAELTALAECVKRGAGLMMLGGFHSFGRGGYANSPLADVLPVVMDNLERQRLADDAIRTDVHLAGPLKMRPNARAAAGAYVMHLSADANREAWEKLPPLDGANKFLKVKPAAHVLAEAEAGQPLLVAQEAGNGRILAFAGDSTWRWVMQGQADAHKRFWRQAVLWLAHKDQLSDGAVWIQLDQRRHAPAGRVEFTAGAKSPQGDPVVDAEFKAEMVLPDKTRKPVQLSRLTESMAGSFLETQAAGDYTVVVTATKDGASLGAAQARFLVYEQDLELDNSAADRTLLDSLAAVTQGKSLAPEQLPELLEELKKIPQSLEIEIQAKRTLWDTWWLFLLLVGLLCTEWYLRKKWGLV